MSGNNSATVIQRSITLAEWLLSTARYRKHTAWKAPSTYLRDVEELRALVYSIGDWCTFDPYDGCPPYQLRHTADKLAFISESIRRYARNQDGERYSQEIIQHRQILKDVISDLHHAAPGCS